ncbi:MAG: PorT family protein [Bacteroidetes bacterium]|nr:MAG: PorT family protein [Bacteroidota bacterium]
MKKILFILLFLIGGYTVQSQVLITLLLGDKLNSPNLEFGLDGGVNWTRVSGMETKNFATKWNLGFYFNFRLKNQWWLYTGVLVKSNMGVDNLTDNDLSFLQATIYKDIDDNTQRAAGDYSQKMSTFLVPVLVKYKFKNHLYAELGPQFGLTYKSWIEFEADIEGRDAIIKEFNKEKLNKFDVGIMVGLGYTLFKGTGWTLGAKYYYGFVDVYKERSGTKNSSIFLKLNIPIGAGEEAQKKAAEKAAKKKAKKLEKKKKGK